MVIGKSSIPTVISVVGARPNFMKVAPIHRAFASLRDTFRHIIVHTGQHYDVRMSDAFFADLDMPQPEHFLGVGSGSHAQQTARIMVGFEEVCMAENPRYVIVVGDVNSTIACALTSVKLGITTGHVEAGLRSFDRAMPEEINRIATDAIVDDRFVTEESGREHLVNEGVPENSIHFVGNTMIDSMLYALPRTETSTVLQRLKVQPHGYALVTLHRPSNVDNPQQLRSLITTLNQIAETIPVIFPVHPRTQTRIHDVNVRAHPKLLYVEPVGYIDFLTLMRFARFALTDSGGIQEETTALSVPCITVRTTTERPITVTLGTNVLIKPEPSAILNAVEQVLKNPKVKGSIPPLWDGKAAERIVSIITNRYA